MIRMKRSLLFASVLIFLVIVPNRMVAQLNANSLTSYEESEGSFVFDVMADRTGIIWFATQGGLIKYDGYEFKSFHQDPNNTETIGSILTYSLHEDLKGNIWIGCMGLVSRFDPNSRTFKNYNIEGLTSIPLFGQAYVQAISSDGEGNIFFGVRSRLEFDADFSLLYYNEVEDSVLRVPNPNGLVMRNVQSAASDAQGNPWFRCDNGIFYIGEDGVIQQAQIPESLDSEGYIRRAPIAFDLDGLLWTFRDGYELYSMDPNTGKSELYSTNAPCINSGASRFPIDMVFDNENNLWLATGNGIIYADIKNGSIDCLDWIDDPDVLLGAIYCVDVDAFGDMWFGTRDKGLLRYSTTPMLESVVTRSADMSGLTPGWAFTILESHDGNIWISTSGGAGYGGLNMIDPATKSVTNYPINELHPDVSYLWAFVEEAPGTFLVSTNNGTHRYNVDANTLVPADNFEKIDSALAVSFHIDIEDNTWVCTLRGLFVQYANTDTFHQLFIYGADLDSLNYNFVTRIEKSTNHDFWILTNRGLYSYESSGNNIRRHGADSKLGDVFVSQDINSLCEASDGAIWVGTWGGGLSKYDITSGSIKTYTMDDGLPSLGIQGILEDEDGQALWISTFSGLTRFNLETEQFTNLSLKDGVQGKSFADGAYLKTSEGLMVFGGSNGINIFDPGDVVKDAIVPLVYITQLEVGNSSSEDQSILVLINPTFESEAITLKHSENNLSIDYAGIHYANPERNKFAFKLENYDEDWRHVGNQRAAYYNNLPPGKYAFKVKAANSNGVWNEEGAMINIHITPPWWKTWWAYGVYVFCLLIGAYAIERALRRRVIEKQRSLTRDKELAQAKEIEKAYVKLKTTQTQLVHAEKMASLGELTAGIAHEIQNPLNFVNNFAEVSVDLLGEMHEEMSDGNTKEVNAIAEDLKQNLEKINFHGQRASGIVKGMLEHSRAGDGLKLPTDINVLADEYLRLAYHGLRAKDKSFNADFKTEFDDSIPQISVIPQEIARVLLNLINNAFHAVREKVKESGESYRPTVTVSTSAPTESFIEINVKDNGNGIPKSILDKIFQPFYTTKPSGEGTGLGLSLSYDIIKAHGGELKVNTEEGKGSEFVIILPHNS